MRKHAMIINNRVVAIKEVDDETYAEVATQCQLLVDVEDMSPAPTVGWALSGSTLTPITAEYTTEMLMGKIKSARLFGAQLVGEMVDRIGAKNIMLGKTEQEILMCVVALDPVKKLLEGGALTTAKNVIISLKSVYPHLAPEMDIAIAKINAALGL